MKIYSLIGLSILLTGYLTMFITFLRAYFNGYEILVTINSLGEAQLELTLLVITIPFMIYHLKEVKK